MWRKSPRTQTRRRVSDKLHVRGEQTVLLGVWYFLTFSPGQCQRCTLALPGGVTFGIVWNSGGTLARGSACTLWYLPQLALTKISTCSLSRYQELNGAKVQTNFPPFQSLIFEHSDLISYLMHRLLVPSYGINTIQMSLFPLLWAAL